MSNETDITGSNKFQVKAQGDVAKPGLLENEAEEVRTCQSVSGKLPPEASKLDAVVENSRSETSKLPEITDKATVYDERAATSPTARFEQGANNHGISRIPRRADGPLNPDAKLRAGSKAMSDTLAYKLGRELIQGTRSAKGMLLLPFKLWRTNKEFRRTETQFSLTNAEAGSLRNGHTATSSMSRSSTAIAGLKQSASEVLTQSGYFKNGQIDVRASADLYVQWAKDHSFDLILKDREHLLEKYFEADAHFLTNFGMMLLASKVSAFSASVEFYERISERRTLAEIQAKISKRAFVRLAVDAAVALARVGRISDARALIDPFAATEAYSFIRARAEICWPSAPQLAIADLRKLKSTGKATHTDLLLLAYISPEKSSVSEISSSEKLLVSANLALEHSDFSYRTLLNEFLDTQELSPVSFGGNVPFDFRDLHSTSQPDNEATLVSVIMTTYNSEDTVEYAIRSILQQTHNFIELIVIDDCSSDDTVKLLEDFQASDERVKILTNTKNLGTYASRNLAITIAAGTYVTFHDSDDWAHPQRLELHVAAMNNNTELIASRSEWLRLTPTGSIALRRWGKKFQHANPASVFYRRSIHLVLGYFDSVRFGADSEFWFRVQKKYGRARTLTIPKCLAFGRLHGNSLTQSGAGAMSEENFSAVRSDYCYSYSLWHHTVPSDRLRLGLGEVRRPFWAPDVMLSDQRSTDVASVRFHGRFTGTRTADEQPNVFFGISLASAQVTKDWARTCRLLGHTIRSLANQTDGDFTIAVVGHEKPEIEELNDNRVVFLRCDRPAPKEPAAYRKDKMYKRRIAGSFLRDLGGGYFFPLDADDLVHKGFVELVRADDNRNGYLVDKGFVLDYNNAIVATTEAVWDASYDRVCGSSAALYFLPSELPHNGNDKDPELYFNLFQSHAYWPNIAREYGRPLKRVPFAAGVYVVNHSQNLSFGLQRSGQRAHNIVKAINENALSEGMQLLVEQFAITRDTLI